MTDALSRLTDAERRTDGPIDRALLAEIVTGVSAERRAVNTALENVALACTHLARHVRMSEADRVCYAGMLAGQIAYLDKHAPGWRGETK